MEIMKPLRVALLNASYNDEATKRNFGRDVDAEIESFAANENELPEGYGYDAAIVSGSAASVYWNEPWIEALTDWVSDGLERDIPILGVCFGHQLLAQALGGEVRDARNYELGYREISRVGDSVLLSGLPKGFLAFATHSDEVTELPPGGRLIATNDHSVQGFRAGHAFGVQFHPEYDRETAERVAQDKDLPDERIRSVLDGITEGNVAAAADAKTLFDNFLGYAEWRSSGGESVDAETTGTSRMDGLS